MGLKDVSIVVPARNAEVHLRETLKSVEPAGTAGAEVVLVDDGSTDRTSEVFSEIAARWPAVQLVRQSWSGLGAARNTGLAATSRRFVVFLDSDDYLYVDGLERLVHVAGKGFAPVCRGGEFRHSAGSHPSEARGSGSVRLVDSRRALLSGFGGTLRYLYEREFLVHSGIRYPTNLAFAEDLPFAAELAARVREFPDVDFPLYSYQIGRTGQLTASNRSDTWPQLVDSFSETERRVGPYDRGVRSAVAALEVWYAWRGLPQASGPAASEARAAIRTFAAGARRRLSVPRSAMALDFLQILTSRSRERLHGLLNDDAR